MVWTNLGKQRLFEEFFEASSISNNFRLQLASDAVPSTDTGVWDAKVASTSEVTLVSAAVVGVSGLQVTRNSGLSVDFDVSGADALGQDAARAVLQTTGNAFQFNGPITNARYVLLTEEDPSFNANNAEIYAWWDIGSLTNITTGNTLTINNLTLQGN